MPDVAIVGAGLTGLSCALTLQQRGIDVQIFEAKPHVGGRVSSQWREGFCLDRGFQIFLNAYPEARRLLDYAALGLQPIYPGAYIQTRQGGVWMGDPFRKPQDALKSALSHVGLWSDKMRILALRQGLLSCREMPIRLAVRHLGFSEPFIQGFLQPFLSGVFLDPDLETSSHLFFFVMKMFSQGDASLPAQGMQAIPNQLAARLQVPIRFSEPVASVAPGKLTLASGERVRAKTVVVATEMGAAARLLKRPPPQVRAARTLYLATRQAPLSQGILILNGQGIGPIQQALCLSQVSPHYAPQGQHLVAACLMGSAAEGDWDRLWSAVLTQLRQWFPDHPQDWELLWDCRIREALPLQLPPLKSRNVRIEPGLFAGGDYTETASINGALQAGRHLAESITLELKH